MKKILLLSISLFFIALSCKKDSSSKANKIIENAFLCFEKPFLSRTDSVYIGVRYFKNYKEKDNITVTLNGQSGEALGPLIEELGGTNYLFRFAARNAVGDLKVLLRIDNGQNVFIKEKILKIVENYALETSWDNFDNTYIAQCFPLMNNPKSTKFGPIVSYSLGFAFSIGSYFEKPASNFVIPYYKFIPAINGAYVLNYDDSKRLQNLTVYNGGINDFPTPNYNGIINDMKVVYGQPASVTNDNNGFKITKFLTTRLQILVYERRSLPPSYTGIVTIVTLK